MKPLAMLMALIACTGALSGCEGNQSVLNAYGSSAIHIKELIIWVVVVCCIIWAAVMVVLIWALARSRRGQSRSKKGTERRTTFAVLGSVALTVFVIAGFTIASFLTTRTLGEAQVGDLTIKVSGEQWWWKIAYAPSAVGPSFDAANEIHIPVGRNVRLELEADDVIHSFWVPSLAGKQDLIPGRSNQLSLRAERPGVYRGQCAEFCGLQHGHMAVLVVAEPAAEFERWAEMQRAPALQSDDPEAKAGEAVFIGRSCAACHTVRGIGATGSAGPDLTHVGGRMTIGAGLLETTRGSLAAWVADPQTLKPGNNMPMVPLSSDELRQVSAYLASLK